MAKSRPFAYNPGSQIPGTQKFGNLTVGSHDLTPDQSGVQWWNGPDEDLGYVIAQTNVDGFGNPLQPTQIPNVYGSVGFFRTDGKNTTAFINLTNAVSGQNFTTATQCKTWLESNNRWTSWSDFATEAIVAFKTRVLSSSGNFEAETNLENQLNTLGSTLFDSASLVITPNAYKEQTLYSIKPDKVGNNLLLWSEQFDNSYWNKTRCSIVSNQEIAPDGSLTADYVVEDSTTGLRYVGRIGVPTSIGQTYTFSVFVKKKDRSRIMFQINEGNSLYPTVVFDFDIQGFTQTTPLLTSSFQSVANGWFRIILTRTPTTGTSSVIGIYPTDINGNYSGTGDGVSRTIIWGAQVELGSTATDYISTTDRAIVNGTIGDLTVTRATTATRVNEQGLIEPVPYNILSYSEDFSNSYWVKLNVTVIPNSGISPIGTMTASTIIPTTTPTQVRNTTVFGVGGETYIWSCYIKSNGLRYVSLTAWNSDDPVTTFDLQNGVVVSQSGPPSTAKITNVGNGWYLCEVSRVLRTDYTGIWLRIAGSYLDNSNLINGSNGYLVWGAQVVRSNEAKPYQLTTNRLNVPRINYTTGNPTILVEPQRTNLILQSEDFTNGWAQEGTSVSGNTQTSPDGALTADSIFELATNDVHRTYRSTSITVTANQLYSASFFVKKNNIRWVRLILTQSGSTTIWAGAQFDLDTKTFTSQVGIDGGTFSSASITSLVNGWYRINVVGSIPSTGMHPMLVLSNGTTMLNTDTRGCPIYLGNVNNELYVWGGQLELGSSTTSYIPTTTSSVTRNADVISKSGISNLIGQTEGSIYVEFDRTTETIGFKALVVIYGDNWLTNSLYIQTSFNSNIDLVIGFIINSTQYQSFLSLIKGKNKLALVYDTTGCDIFLNGVKLARRSLPSFPSVYNLHLFNSPLGRQYGSGYLFSLWKTKLTDQQAIQLTTL